MVGRIVAIGGLSPDHDDDALHRMVVSLARRRLPRVCYLPVASGDDPAHIEASYRCYPPAICEPTHVELLRSVPREPAAVLREQDVIYVGGGSTPVLVAALRAHLLDEVLRVAWENGTVLCGDSAGSHVLVRK